jgi:hypothetical protein
MKPVVPVLHTLPALSMAVVAELAAANTGAAYSSAAKTGTNLMQV